MKGSGKTNKSFSKRLRVTKRGKILARKSDGKYKAKDSGRKQQAGKKTRHLVLSQKIIDLNLPFSGL
ncbi:MAG TPA: hypothetical protein VJI73_03935 [Candidatus Paceibacterota bacterium]